MHSTADASFVDARPLLEPRSIAVVGASDQPGNVGGDTVRRLLKFKFPGRVWPVNRTAVTVCDLPCAASVAELPEVPELVIFAIPAHALLDAIRECADAGVRHGIAYAGGLAEAGGEGVVLQRALVALCRERGFVLCGPNCVGIINATTPVTATFATALYEMEALRPGVISMVCQSGGIATTSFSMVQQAGFGFRYLVSSGNEAVVGFADYLHAFARDPGTRIIGGYLEGITDGPKFVARARRGAPAEKAGGADQGRHDRCHGPCGAGAHRRAGRRGPGRRRHPQGDGRDARLLGRGARRSRADARRQYGQGLFGPGGGLDHVRRRQRRAGRRSMRAKRPHHAGIVPRMRGAPAAVAGFRRERGQSAGSHADHRLSSGSAGAASACPGRHRCRAGYSIAAVHRGLARLQGRRNLRRHLRTRRARGKAGVRELAVAAARRARAPRGAGHLFLSRSGARHPGARQDGRARRRVATARAAGTGRARRVRLVAVRAAGGHQRSRTGAHVPSDIEGRGSGGGRRRPGARRNRCDAHGRSDRIAGRAERDQRPNHASCQGGSRRDRSALVGGRPRGLPAGCARAPASSKSSSTASTCKRCIRARPSSS